MRLLIPLVLSCLLLSACDQPAPPEAQAPAPVVAVAEPAGIEPTTPDPASAAQPAASSQPGVSFTIEQVQGDCNPETPYRARLSWKIDDPGKAMIAIRAESPGNGDMATHDAQEYSAETGDWVRQGMPFYLIDRSSGETLATVTAAAESCG